MNRRFAMLSILFGFPLISIAEEIKVWSNSSGLASALFCEKNRTFVAISPGIGAYANALLDDGSRVEIVEEQGFPASVTCLSENNPRTYFLVKFTKDSREKIVAVSGEETEIFQKSKSLWDEVSANSSAQELRDIPDGVEVKTGNADFVVCIAGNSLNVRDELINRVLFQVPRFATVKVVQSFGIDRIKKNIGGIEYVFVKAEFNASQLGWVAEKYIVPRSQCPGANTTTETWAAGDQTWTFPTLLRPSASYKEGMRRFKAGRSGGRLHAACDLYRVKDEKVNSASSGKVIRGKYYFYEGTYAIEVKHTGGKVARYGEITGKQAPGISLNATVGPGQVIGYIGKVNSGCCTPMLHFELYSGTASGSLSQKGNAFQRRSDLIDPTALLTEWEKNQFGSSY